MRLAVIANPHAAAGRTGKRLRGVRECLLQRGVEATLLETKGPGHATELARRAASEGFDRIGVLGGDGTLSEVCRAYLDDEGRPLQGPELALLPSGTGGDTSRTWGASSRIHEAVDALVESPPVPMDLTVVRLRGPDGGVLTRAMINIGSVGISGAIAARVNAGGKRVGGRTAFLFATLAAAVEYRNLPVEIALDGEVWHRGPIGLFVFANGQYFGGGMHIAPQARPDDGLLDIVCLADAPRIKLASWLPRIYQGRHLELPEFRSGRCQTLRVAALGDRGEAGSAASSVELDGETPGALPLEAHVLPGALSVVASVPAPA